MCWCSWSCWGIQGHELNWTGASLKMAASDRDRHTSQKKPPADGVRREGPYMALQKSSVHWDLHPLISAVKNLQNHKGVKWRFMSRLGVSNIYTWDTWTIKGSCKPSRVSFTKPERVNRKARTVWLHLQMWACLMLLAWIYCLKRICMENKHRATASWLLLWKLKTQNVKHEEEIWT